MAAKSDESDISSAWMYYSKEAVSSSRDLLDDDDVDDDASVVQQHMSLISLPEEEEQKELDYSSSGSACYTGHHYDLEDIREVADNNNNINNASHPPGSYRYDATQSCPTSVARVVSVDTTSAVGEASFKRQKLCSARWMKSLVAEKQNCCERSKWPRVSASTFSVGYPTTTTSSKAYGKRRHIVESAP